MLSPHNSIQAPIASMSESISQIISMRREIQRIRSQAHRESRPLSPIDNACIADLHDQIATLLDHIDLPLLEKAAPKL